MIVRRLALLLTMLAGLALAACEDKSEVAAPAPQALTREAIGHYCNMIVADHKGPKGQIFLSGEAAPIWFSSVRDTIAFTMLPDEPKNIAAIYVTDVGRASWDSPEPDTWIEARSAWYVIGSDRRGGMGAPEVVPFADKAAAARFAETHGGEVVAFTEIPQTAILTAEAAHEDEAHDAHDGHGDAGHADHDMKMPSEETMGESQ